MVILPSVVLLVMWAVFSSYTIFEGFYLRTVGLGVKEASIPAVNSLVALQKERQLTMLSLGHSPAATATLPAQRAETDRAVDQMKSKMQGLLSGAPENIVQGADKLVSLLDQLPQERGRIDGHTASPEEIFDYYNSVLDAGGNLFETQSRLVPDGESIQGALTATDLFRAADQMSRVASLGGNAVAAGRFTPEQHTTFVSLVGSYRSKLITNAPNLQPQAKAEYEQLLNSDAWRNLQQLENRLISSPRQDGELGVSEQQWLDASNQVADELVKIVTSHSTQAVELVLANGNARYFEVIIGSAVALLAVVLGIVLAIRNSRRLVDRALVTRLANLRTDSLTLAQERLPDIMTRLERGEKVDIESELPALDYGGDEIGQVADAFNTAQFTAVSAAVKESQAREGVNKVFLGIAHRNQGLVHRQLKVLDKMEREEENPERLDTLFQLDHLATRARRNAENLIILAGEQPGRQWRKPVRLVDVLRAAVAETEQYHRVRVNQVPEVAVHGTAVGDVIHLCAELMENATAFSSPRSQVQVHSSDTPRGVLVQIEDQGLGMRPAARDDANELLVNPPRFEDITLRGDSRLGLFVVARLAARRGIEVDLRESAEGGIVAFVLLPSEIVVSEKGHEDPPETMRVAAANQLSPMVPRNREDSTPATERDLPAPRREVEPVVRNGRKPSVPAETQNDKPEFPSVDPDGRPPLPRRRRQQNLVPQLRDEPLEQQEEREYQVDHSPERTRGNMTAFQRGTRKARRSDDGSDRDSLQ
ncbi:signal transduction histidine kinase [Saccharopolyspora erythraea NRRL 2338]|uniref:histidine kinase n=1 Tax=Saccharopolyspora erythraea TaxID=1836 RepID=A0ABN1CH20_SACER|nr:nitrate- and nitrite sensing domain-containing protein [Saccharopolyspora erythraea]EQD82955.1 histidine kinase [Saccharopolyspora erythraea D]PFG95046.1 signal transduction histidine kinase [Saccharopolyspora erythraea NRRL 2338]